MDDYLREHFFVKFLVFLLLGIGVFVFSYRILKSYKKEELEPIKENTYSRMIYWRSIGGMCLGLLIILMSFYMIFEDLTQVKENNDVIMNVQVRK
ncbi:hypothetical protein QX233_04900 [Chryseobacterium gambrini]|uniref:Uncharacterized protein n=1 Tax=Chryseobacterium gambrini TaxID=373672 RepID=A0AAJ1R209_9FLAO|nr:MULTISPECIES: hypothetical protein [Chryseobacterium]MDN4011792.1 hypothetical protein [Chryseobacterium gambrini]MDN4029503.1 hypothetical protein [Chryseobacterium gambrini]QWA40713.1 hypothetical protein KKI44_11180 [Chryseobacterium sp. ZHDP1]